LVFKVIQGHCFQCQSKASVGLSISEWPYLAPFLRYSDLLAENRKFFLPPPISGGDLCGIYGQALRSWN